MFLQIRRMTENEAWQCADLMASTEPWITLQRTREHTHHTVTNPHFETYVAVMSDENIAGVVSIAMEAPLIRGYIVALAVKQGHRNEGIGAALLAHAEQRILRDSPNIFLCVSSFNFAAQRFYERHGYQQVGVLKDLIIAGASEHLLRKTSGPWNRF